MDKKLVKENDALRNNSENVEIKKSQSSKQNKKLNVRDSIQYLKQQKVNVSHQKTQEAKRKARDWNMNIKLIIVQKQVLQSKKRDRKSYILEIEAILHAQSLKKALKNLKELKTNKNKERSDIKDYIRRYDTPIESRPDITNNDCFIVGKRFIQNELLKYHNNFDVKSLEKELNDKLNQLRSAMQNPTVIPNDSPKQNSNNN